MPQLAILMWSLALTPHADYARRRPYGALQEVILAQVPALVRNVAQARTEGRCGCGFHQLFSPWNHVLQEGTCCWKADRRSGQGGRASGMYGFTVESRGEA